MISDTTISCAEETLGTEDEYSEGINYLKSQISKLSLENERCKQELHDVQRKLEISRTMEAEFGELQRTLEQSLDHQKAQSNRKIHEMEEKQVAREKELQDKLVEIDGELSKSKEENRHLRETIRSNEEKFLALNQSQHSTIIEENTDLLKSQIEELTELLTTEGNLRTERDQTVRMMETEIDELREILAGTKKQLSEKNEVVESMRGELFECRMELESLKTAPATDKSKGNSLFAEVEDRRKMTLGQMNAMRSSYLEAKRSFQAKEAEIRALKAERSLLLRKWEDDTIEKIQQDASLVEKYKARIGELESRLKEEHKKQKQTIKSQQMPENNFTFLQSMVDAKTKQIEELSTKIENDSIKAILEEENKHKMGKQLRYWRYRAMSAEAELLSIKNRLESDPSSSNIEILETIKKRLDEKTGEPNDTFKAESSYMELTLVNETVVTLEKLMTIPKAEPRESSLPSAKKINESIESLKSSENERIASVETSIVKVEPATMETSYEHSEEPDCRRMDDSMDIEEEITKTFRKPVSIENDENDGKNLNFNSKTTEPVLKSVLSKQNENETLILSNLQKNEKEKKTLRFTADTIDPPGKTPKKQSKNTPKYPIVFISSNKKK